MHVFINIVERIYEDDPRINCVLHERADMQMECSEDAISIEWIHVGNIMFFEKMENQNSLGELL